MTFCQGRNQRGQTDKIGKKIWENQPKKQGKSGTIVTNIGKTGKKNENIGKLGSCGRVGLANTPLHFVF